MPPEIHRLGSGGNPGQTEVFTPLLEGSRFRAEHIESHGAASPPEFWYDQEHPEWVVLLSGTASLEFDDGIVHLKAGDFLTIPTRVKHRIAATSPDATWLALHFQSEQPLPEQPTS